MVLKENEFQIIIEDDLRPKLKEPAQMRKQIGEVGELVFAPLIRMKFRNLWELNLLGL